MNVNKQLGNTSTLSLQVGVSLFFIKKELWLFILSNKLVVD